MLLDNLKEGMLKPDLYEPQLNRCMRPCCALLVPSPFKQRMGALLPEAATWAMFNKAQEGREQYLKAGDVVEARIQSPDGAIDLGLQRNKGKRPANTC